MILKKTQLLFIALLLFTIPLTVLVAKNQQSLRQEAAVQKVPSVSFLLNPNSGKKQVGQTFTVAVSLKAGINRITGVDLSLIYNSNTLELQKFQAESNLTTKLINKIDQQKGIFRYAAVDTQGFAIGNVALGTLTFKAKSPGTSNLLFQNIQVTALGQKGSIQSRNNTQGRYTIVKPRR